MDLEPGRGTVPGGRADRRSFPRKGATAVSCPRVCSGDRDLELAMGRTTLPRSLCGIGSQSITFGPRAEDGAPPRGSSHLPLLSRKWRSDALRSIRAAQEPDGPGSDRCVDLDTRRQGSQRRRSEFGLLRSEVLAARGYSEVGGGGPAVHPAIMYDFIGASNRTLRCSQKPQRIRTLGRLTIHF